MVEKETPNGFIPSHGGYRKLYSYQKAEVIYDGTVYFTKRFFDKYDRTASQMLQAARSGKQNIAEGSMLASVSREGEIKLTGVARASLEELRIDYEDFLRTRNMVLWDKDHRLVARVRELNTSTPNPNYATFQKAIEHEDPEICANTMVTLIHICTFLLSRYMKQLEGLFIAEGGLREKMANARYSYRRKNK